MFLSAVLPADFCVGVKLIDVIVLLEIQLSTLSIIICAINAFTFIIVSQVYLRMPTPTTIRYESSIFLSPTSIGLVHLAPFCRCIRLFIHNGNAVLVVTTMSN